MYRVQISEPRLNKVRVVTAANPYELHTKVDAQRRLWREMWERKVEADARKAQRERQAMNKEQKIALAAEETKEAELAIQEAQEILSAGLKQALSIDWEGMKNRAPFRESKPSPPEKPVFPDKPDPRQVPEKPDPTDEKYRPKHTLMSSLVPGRKEREIEQAIGRFHADIEAQKPRSRITTKRSSLITSELKL
jgi:restriction system protein